VISDASNKNISAGSFVLQSGNSGIAVYAGGTITYNIGDSVVLNVTTTDSLLNYQGSLELKLHYGVTLPSPVATNVSVTPTVKTIAQINTALALPLNNPNDFEYTLVQISSATASGNATYSGNNTLTDASGSITLYTAAGATFASTALPAESGDWTGYAHNFNTTPEFSIRNLNDVTASPVPPPSSSSFTAVYTFSDVTTTSGTTDPTPAPTVTGLTFGNFTANGVSANPNAGGRFSFTGWNTSSLDETKYDEVTITPNSGVTFDLSELTLTLQRSGTGVTQIAIRSSLDGFANNLPVTINPANSNLTVNSDNSVQITNNPSAAQTGTDLVFDSNFSGLAAPVTFRFYGFGASAASGTFSLNNVTFTGTVK
jgi:hypothetical protein